MEEPAISSFRVLSDTHEAELFGELIKGIDKPAGLFGVAAHEAVQVSDKEGEPGHHLVAEQQRLKLFEDSDEDRYPSRVSTLRISCANILIYFLHTQSSAFVLHLFIVNSF